MKILKRIVEDIRILNKKGAFHILFGNVINKFIAMFGSILLVRILSKNDFGLLSYVENFFGYLLAFSGFGLANAILRYIVKQKENHSKKTIFDYVIFQGKKNN